MAKKIFDRGAEVVKNVSLSLKSLVKCGLMSHRVKYKKADGESIIILGNGPSLNETIAAYSEKLTQSDLLAVNFAANTPVFSRFRPRYYVLADPHFFSSEEPNVLTLRANLNAVDWPMTLFLPFGSKMPQIDNPNIVVERFNMIGVEGFESVSNSIYKSRRGMPRPRNVLIPSIMIALWLGYKKIFIAGADHTWTKTLAVSDANEVISVQPHFYNDDKAELSRTATVYKNVRIHEILESFSIAFKAYHAIARYARRVGVKIYNVTPGSFIDAFERTTL